MVRSRSLYASMSSERPFPWGGRRGKNLSSLRHISIAVASALGVCQATHQHGDTTIDCIARWASRNIIHLHSDPAARLLHGNPHLQVSPHLHGNMHIPRPSINSLAQRSPAHQPTSARRHLSCTATHLHTAQRGLPVYNEQARHRIYSSTHLHGNHLHSTQQRLSCTATHKCI